MQKVFSKDGTVISYLKKGDGSPLLLVHGTTADHQRWSSILPRFEQHFTVYAMDRRGRGESGDSPEYAIEREAEDVAAVVEAIGEPTAILGHSYGAVCSLEAALLTDKVSRLILYEPPLPTGLPQYPQMFLTECKPSLTTANQNLLSHCSSERSCECQSRNWRLIASCRCGGHGFNWHRLLPENSYLIELTISMQRNLPAFRYPPCSCWAATVRHCFGKPLNCLIQPSPTVTS